MLHCSQCTEDSVPCCLHLREHSGCSICKWVETAGWLNIVSMLSLIENGVKGCQTKSQNQKPKKKFHEIIM